MKINVNWKYFYSLLKVYNNIVLLSRSKGWYFLIYIATPLYTITTIIDEIQKSMNWTLLSFRSREWKPESEGNCYGEKEPIYNEGYWGSGSDLPTMSTVEKILSNLSSKVSVINITQLSEYRKDGHPSIFRKFWEPLRPQQLSNPSSYSDCIHWCLPGVPDVWNELLFHFL